MRKPDPSNPPNTKAYFKFYAEKWDHAYARNVLLEFVRRQRLDGKLIKWLNKYFPDENES